MSLVQARWVVPAIAALVAVAAPLWLLGSNVADPEAPPPLIVTELPVAAVGGFAQARSAPLFAPGRAPPAPPPTPEELAAAAAAPAARPLPALVGLVSRARGRGVALVKSSNGETLTLSPGETVDGWQLVGIGRDRATFAANGERRVAVLDFSNKSGGQPAAPPRRSAGEGAPESAAPPPGPQLPRASVPAGSPLQPLPPWPEPWLSNPSGNRR